MIDDLTLKARIMAANPNDIEKLLSRNAGGNRREAYLPGYANKRYGKEQAAFMQSEGEKAGRAKDIQTTQERQAANLEARQNQAANSPNMIYPTKAPAPTAASKVGRSSGTEAQDRASLSASHDEQQAHLRAQGVGGTNPISTPSMPGGKNGTEVPDNTETKIKVENGAEGASQVQQITTHKNDEVPENTEQGGDNTTTANPAGQQPSPSPAIPGSMPQTTAQTQQPLGGPMPQTAAQPMGAPAPPPPNMAAPLPTQQPTTMTGGDTNSLGGGQQMNPVFNIGAGGQGQQQQGQAAPQNDPRTNAKNAQVQAATERSKTKGGLATNPLLGAMTMGGSNLAGMAWNKYQRGQGKKELSQLTKRITSPYSKVLSVFEIRKGISARNTTEVLRRGRI